MIAATSRTRRAPRPSVKTLEAVAGNEGRDAARKARSILLMSRSGLAAELPEMSRLSPNSFASMVLNDLRMHALDEALKTHGVEYTTTASKPREVVAFLNAGDTYSPTVILWRGTFRVQSLGDFIETMERRGIRFA